MRYRTVPGTALRVSEIGFGCGGNAGLMVRGEAAEQAQVVGRALELGITYFDTAPDYGNGAAELALGRALRAAAAERPVIATKVEIRREDLPDIAGHVVRSTQQSLHRLRVERIDVLQIHNGPAATPPAMENGDYHKLWIEHFLGPRGALEGLRRVREAGLAAYLGFGCRGGDGPELGRLLATGMFRMINVPYNLLNQTAGGGSVRLPGGPDYADALGAALRAGCGVAVYSPLAGGFLAGSAAPHTLARARNRASASASAASRFEAFAGACGGSMAQAAYRFVLAHSGTTTALGGFSSLAQLDEIAAVADRPSLPPELLEAAARPHTDVTA